MRPPEFTGGNGRARSSRSAEATRFNEAAGIHRRKPATEHVQQPAKGSSFNEAAGIHRRKLAVDQSAGKTAGIASMRPPEFTGGNSAIDSAVEQNARSFNEAAGIHRRKPRAGGSMMLCRSYSFNEAAGIHRRKPTPSSRVNPSSSSQLQ